jgi:hypothetical protein
MNLKKLLETRVKTDEIEVRGERHLLRKIALK